MFYLNRIIKVISPFTFQTFKIELNGEENELRELLATILNINPNSIKGLRDSYNNYYTLSSAVKNPHINTNPYNYYTVITKNASVMNIKNNSLMKSPSYNYNLLKHNKIYSMQNDNSINYHNNFLNNTYNFYEDNNLNLNYKNNDVSEFLSFADDLYKKNYIDYNLVRKLKRLIRENNEEVLDLMSPFINLKSHKSYDEFTKRIMPIISTRSPIFENNEESNEDNSSSISNNDKNKKGKVVKLTKEEKILEGVKSNFSKEKFNKLKKLLKKKNKKKIIKIIKNYEKNKDYNLLISKLSRLINELEEENEDEEEYSSNNVNSDSGNDSDEGKSQKSKKKKKNQSKLKEKDIKKITKNIINSLKDKGIDIYYTSKFDLQRLSDDEKVSLYTKKFKLPLDSILSSNKIPKKNISIIKNYYQQFISKKVTKNFDENENIVYESLLKQEEENNIMIKCYKDLLKHKNISELRNQIKEIIKETIEGIEEEGEEEEDDEDEDNNQGKNFIKEENEEEKDDEEEEEEEEGDEDEESEKDEDDENSSNKSSDNIIILKDNNKDRGVDLLNNNYRKINNYNFNSKNDDKEKKDSENEKKNEDEQNLGLGFVVVKQKKKDDPGNDSNKNNNLLKLNTTESKQNESSLSTNNPNKKLNQFIQQIEHMKKIDDIKKTIIDAINNNNKYIMELFQKFQKNKFSLNPKALYAIHKQIKENPDSDGKGSAFKLLVKEVPNINENIQDFLCNEFNNGNSELETYYSLYEESKEKDEFFESIEMFMKKPATKQLLEKYTSNKKKDGN